MSADLRAIARLLCLILVLSLAGEVNPWSLLVGSSALVASILWKPRPGNRLLRVFTGLGAVGAGAAIFLASGTAIGRETSAALLSVLVGLKSLESTRASDEKVVALIGLFMVALLFLFRYDLWSTLIGGSAAAGFLWLLLLQGQHAPSRNEAAGWLLHLSLRALPLTILLFVFVPRLQHGGWWTPPAPQTGTGFRDGLDPQNIDQIGNDTTPVMRVTWEGPSPRDPVFWRGAVLEVQDGFSWKPRATPWVRESSLATASSAARRAQLLIEPGNGHWLFAPENTVSLSSTEGTEQPGWFEGHATWRWVRAVEKRLKFNVVVDPEFRLAAEDGRLARADIDAESERWVRQATRGARKPTEIMGALLGAFRDQGFIYTRSPGKIESLAEFLNLKKGFCEHYASALATAARAAGLRARVVAGYLGGEYNPVGGFWLITRGDAHAWVEYVNEDGAWVPADATAVIPPEDPVRDLRWRGDLTQARTSPWERMRWNLESVNYRFAMFMIGFDLDSQKDLWSGLREMGVRWWIVFILLLGLAPILASLVASSLTHRTPREVRAYRRLRERALSRGWVADSSGPLEIRDELLRQEPQRREHIERIIEKYIRRRYGPNPRKV